MRAFLMYIDDWRSSKKISRMDGEERSGYLNMLLYSASEPDCGLPDDDAELAHISELGAQWSLPTMREAYRFHDQRSGQKLRSCFFVLKNGIPVNAESGEPEAINERVVLAEVLPGRLYNQRLLREFQYQRSVARKRSEAGRASWNVRKHTKQTTCSTDVEQMHEQMHEQMYEQADEQNGNNDVCVSSLCLSSNSSLPESLEPRAPKLVENPVAAVSPEVELRFATARQAGKAVTRTLRRLLADERMWTGWTEFDRDYPLKIGMDEAFCAYWELAESMEITPETAPEVLAGLGRYRASDRWTQDGGRYVCSAKVFLIGDGERRRGRMWKDYPPKAEIPAKPAVREEKLKLVVGFDRQSVLR